jgi:hypothetical protein
VAHRPNEKLVAAWTPAEFHQAVRAAAKAAGVSQSEIVRRGIARELIGVAEEPPEEGKAGG